jgi:nicotinate-nucleotide pyrophosphorylase (carboxylating)
LALNNFELNYQEIVREALKEDIGSGDVTTEALITKDQRARARLIAKQKLVLAGIDVAREAFRQLDGDINWQAKHNDGAELSAGEIVAEVEGRMRALLTAERTALNFLQRLSGIATLTAKHVALLKPHKTKLKDTRKTTPGLRQLEKYAVSCGGGVNHRLGLYDGILIKDNHITFTGGITRAVKLARQKAPAGWPIEIEAQTLSQVNEALSVGVEKIMLDNMDPATLYQAVRLIAGRAEIEVSGGITAANIIEIAKLGVDYVSLGELTHSAPAVDIHMLSVEAKAI